MRNQLYCVTLMLFLACETDDNKDANTEGSDAPTVPGQIAIQTGATPDTAFEAKLDLATGGAPVIADNLTVTQAGELVVSTLLARSNVASTPADGKWLVTPNKVKVKLKSIGFGDQLPNDVDCEIEFDSSKPTLADLGQCDVKIPLLPFSNVSVTYDGTAQVLIDDAENSLYTDPTSPQKIVFTRPSDGPGYVEMTSDLADNGTLDASLVTSETIEVSESNLPKLGLIGDMIHKIQFEIVGGVPVFKTSNTTPGFPVELLPVVNGIGKISLYSTVTSGKTFRREDIYPMGGSETEVRVFFDNSEKATYLFLASGNVGGSPNCGGGGSTSGAYAANPKNSPEGNGGKAGGYLGIDESGTIGWARPRNGDFAEYVGVFTMEHRTTIGEKSTLKCQDITSDPAPSSGDTYESGAPDITSPSEEVTMMLIAN